MQRTPYRYPVAVPVTREPWPLGQVPGEMVEDLQAQYSDDEIRRFLSKRRDFYVYEAQALTIAVGATVIDTIQIEADANFILQKMMFQADVAAAQYTDATRPIPNVTILLVDTGSGRQLMQNPIPIASLFGTGQLPFVLPNPRIFMRNSTIQVTFTNFDAAAATTSVRLAFAGYKVYSSV